MKFLPKSLFITILCFAFPIHAETVDKDELLKFAKAIGIYEQVEAQKLALQTRGAQAAQKYVQQISTSMPRLPKQFYQDMEEEMKIYMSNTNSLIDTDFAVDIYIDLISKKLSRSDIEQLTEFYDSELGKKYVKSNIEIMGDWSALFMKDLEKKMLVHLQSFANNLLAKIATYGDVKRPKEK